MVWRGRRKARVGRDGARRIVKAMLVGVNPGVSVCGWETSVWDGGGHGESDLKLNERRERRWGSELD